MYDRGNVVYKYDGSFAGMISCVYDAVYRRERPFAIWSERDMQNTLFPVHEVLTSDEHVRRVLSACDSKIDKKATHLVRMTFLTCLPERELAVLDFLRLGFDCGKRVMAMLGDERVLNLLTAVRHMSNEAHLLKGFTRFSDYSGVMIAEIQPKNFVLPLLAPHFRARMGRESFIIYDSTNGAALLHSKGRSQIVPLSELKLPPASAPERAYRALWKRFYDTIAIEGRENERCRMTHMPKRYWGTMTELLERDLAHGEEGIADIYVPDSINAAQLPQATARHQVDPLQPVASAAELPIKIAL